MSIYKDILKGVLTRAKLDDYFSRNRNILNEQDSDMSYTPLATAVIAGFPSEVELLLQKGAKPDALSRGGETPLLLATWKAAKERPRIVQLLLANMPPGSVDSTTNAAENKTPLMYAISKRDLDSIRMLRRSKASLSIKNNDGFNAREEAEATNDPGVMLALNPEKEQSTFAKWASLVVSFLLYIVAWVNEKLNNLVGRATSGLNPELNRDYDRDVNGQEDPDKNAFVKNVDRFVKENATLERFFKEKKEYVQEVARKAVNLKQESEADLGDNDDVPKTVTVALHKQVIYCDDSTSMKREGRWDNQKKLIARITRITTRVLPEGEGVALRFINRDVESSSNLTLKEIETVLGPMTWQPGGDTQIGTNLRSKILQPLVYAKLESQSLDRPLLVSIITDGMPDQEKKSELVNAIIECGRKLEAAGYSHLSVRFMIGQVGTAKSSTEFLESLRDNTEIAPVVFVTSDRLDEKLATLHDNEQGLDRWLIETLFTPLKEADTGTFGVKWVKRRGQGIHRDNVSRESGPN